MTVLQEPLATSSLTILAVALGADLVAVEAVGHVCPTTPRQRLLLITGSPSLSPAGAEAP